ncbi:helix-turn-helix transcriptional regulator [Actinokineospora sp. NBRC 105648]|uniref:helix-turn-helix domain-containing protein n=1 Tax=Actinokineospora sp. NBRC 105648 TaxID=3032206 RepID=UPI0024A22CC2|nr:helix-turn-helix transcriptional regulator [Actinokineospora sp. NBRC 105648]GLZ38933.1 transcriptional regulator [Actinokineospora sp. NBRC 105648]
MTAFKATAQRRELGTELRRVRENTNLTLHEMARKLGWDPSKLSRIETGKLPCSKVEAATILAYCQVDGAELDKVLATCGSDLDGAWIRDTGIPDRQSGLRVHESLAVAMSSFEPCVIPGLLQIEDYTRALLTGTGLLSAAGVEDRVRIRMGRQSTLRRQSPPNTVFYVSENALRMPVGSPQTMHEQMLHLLFASSQPHCVLRVVPAAKSAIAALDGGFRLMEFTDGHPVVNVDTLNRTLFLERSVDIAIYRLVLGRLGQDALNVADSRVLLSDLASDYDREEAQVHAPDPFA